MYVKILSHRPFYTSILIFALHVYIFYYPNKLFLYFLYAIFIRKKIKIIKDINLNGSKYKKLISDHILPFKIRIIIIIIYCLLYKKS